MRIDPTFFLNIMEVSENNINNLKQSLMDIESAIKGIDSRIKSKINISELYNISSELNQLKSINDNLYFDSYRGYNAFRSIEFPKFFYSLTESFMNFKNIDSLDSNSRKNASNIERKNMVLKTFNDNNYYVIDTPISPLDFAEEVVKNRTHQQFYHGSKCSIVNIWYSALLLLKTKPTRSNYENFYTWTTISSVDGYSNKVNSENLEDIKVGLYNFLNEGQPAVIKVTQQAKNRRHYVTAIGFTEDVKTASDLNPNNILVLDSANGQVSTLATSGYGGRDFYAEVNSKGKLVYEVSGPTVEFLNEVSYRVNLKNQKAEANKESENS